MLPAPLAEQLAPPEFEQVQVTPVSAAGKLSVTIAPVTSLGPVFDTTIVYIVDWPGTVEAWPLVLLIDRFASVDTVSVTVLVVGVATSLLVMEAVFTTSVPLAKGELTVRA